MNFCKIIVIILISLLIGGKCFSQISPGELSNVHSHLEGISNCTKCHILGEKLSNDKCLDCHKELKLRISQNKGYHSSSEVKGKQCAVCHSDHHGKDFQIIHFDEKNFNHNLTGFYLTGAHSKKDCKECHNSKFIANQSIKRKKFTFFGLNSNCISCHKDVHQKTLSSNCNFCHDLNAFKPASKFNHNSYRYKLTGKHITVDCIKCHKIEIKNGEKYQNFKGLQFKSCVNCHEDIHKNKFGQNCTQCHTNESFLTIKGINNFDHSKTKYILEDKHLTVNCKLCHKAKYTTPIKHNKCYDCHKDYHNGEFNKAEITTDCSECHSLKGFTFTTYTIEKHNKSSFTLQGAHTAIPCFDCHKKNEKWKFREIGKKCIDCHKNIHQNNISNKYYPDNDCQSCHSNYRWSEISFDHNKTNFKLLGVHKIQTCRKCHFNLKNDGTIQQKFVGLSSNCVNCHTDKHFNQFEKDGITDCTRCHEFENWKAVRFNHNNTLFKLDGKHEKVECKKCHKTTENNKNNYILYKISVKCESCHT